MDHEFDNLSAVEWLLLKKMLRAYRDNLRFGKAPWIFLTPMCADERPDIPIVLPQNPQPPTSEPNPTLPRMNGHAGIETPPLTPRLADNGLSAVPELGKTCREAILTTLALENRRMTSGEMYQWLQDRAKEYSKEFVVRTLAQMRSDGEINNENDNHGKGYGLTPWT